MTSIMNTGSYVWSYESSILTASLPEGLNRITHLTRFDNIRFDDLKGLEISDLNSYLPVLADSYGNIGDSLSLLRSFGAYLSENSLCSLNLETIFTIKVPNRKKYIPALIKTK